MTALDELLVERLETEAVALLASCSNGVSQLLALLRRVQPRSSPASAVSFADARSTYTVHGDGTPSTEVVRSGRGVALMAASEAEQMQPARATAGVADAPMIFDNQIRSARRSKALFDGHHDALCHLMLRRAQRGL
jgi:hypothetical protein